MKKQDDDKICCHCKSTVDDKSSEEIVLYETNQIKEKLFSYNTMKNKKDIICKKCSKIVAHKCVSCNKLIMKESGIYDDTGDIYCPRCAWKYLVMCERCGKIQSNIICEKQRKHPQYGLKSVIKCPSCSIKLNKNSISTYHTIPINQRYILNNAELFGIELESIDEDIECINAEKWLRNIFKKDEIVIERDGSVNWEIKTAALPLGDWKKLNNYKCKNNTVAGNHCGLHISSSWEPLLKKIDGKSLTVYQFKKQIEKSQRQLAKKLCDVSRYLRNVLYLNKTDEYWETWLLPLVGREINQYCGEYETEEEEYLKVFKGEDRHTIKHGVFCADDTGRLELRIFKSTFSSLELLARIEFFKIILNYLKMDTKIHFKTYLRNTFKMFKRSIKPEFYGQVPIEYEHIDKFLKYYVMGINLNYINYPRFRTRT